MRVEKIEGVVVFLLIEKGRERSDMGMEVAPEVGINRKKIR